MLTQHSKMSKSMEKMRKIFRCQFTMTGKISPLVTLSALLAISNRQNCLNLDLSILPIIDQGLDIPAV